MNKKIISFLIIFFAVFMFLDKCNASSQVYTDGNKFEITINKSQGKTLGVEGSNVVYFDLGYRSAKNLWDHWTDNKVPWYFYTTTSDLAYKDPDIWWETLIACQSVDGKAMGFDSDYIVGVYTDSLESRIDTDEEIGIFLPMFDEEAECDTLTLKDSSISDEQKISTCQRYNEISNKIEQAVTSYKKTKNSVYKTEYTNQLSYLKSSCKKATAFADYNDACVRRCGLLKNDINYWEKELYPNRGTAKCGFSARIIFWIRNILKWIKYILPVFVIVLGMLDFLKALSGDKNEELKKAQGKFIKRLIAAALTFIIPLIIVFILDKMGFGDYVDGCGIVDI